MKISILTPSYNSGKYIRRAIESVLRQDYQDWEHIVMDGGSTDGTVDVLKMYSHLDWESTHDEGQSDAMNKAFTRSTGDIVIYLNADDELNEGLLSHVVDKFIKYPEIDMFVGNLTVHSEKGEKVIKPSTSLYSILHYKSYSFPLNPVSYAYKSSLQRKIGQFPLDNHLTMDYWFLLRAYLKGSVMKHEFNCGTFYFDGNNKSSNKETSVASLASVRKEFVRANFYHPLLWKYLVASFMRNYLFFSRK